MPTAAQTIVPAALTLLAERAPLMRVEMTEAPPEEGLFELAARRFDLVIAEQYPGQTRERRTGTEHLLIGEDPLRLVLPPTERPHALRQAILACRKGGVVSVAGVFGGFADKIPLGAAFNKGLTFKMGQTHVHRYLQPLLEKIEQGAIDPSVVITHKLSLDDAPDAYRRFRDKEDGCIKVMLRP